MLIYSWSGPELVKLSLEQWNSDDDERVEAELGMAACILQHLVGRIADGWKSRSKTGTALSV